jgi:metal-sulfur cluster biosynthetic enzyme
LQPPPGADQPLEHRATLLGPPCCVARVITALRGVCDPAVGENIVDLGLVECLRLTRDEAELVLADTSDACPLSDLLADGALRAMQQVLPDTDLFVRSDPLQPWGPHRLSDEARRRWIGSA